MLIRLLSVQLSVIDTAIERGANAIIGMRFDTSAPIGSSHMEMLVYGTAVNIKRDNGKHSYHHYDDNKKHVSFKDVGLSNYGPSRPFHKATCRSAQLI